MPTGDSMCESSEDSATSPCHQGHQQGQGDRWGQSDRGHHLFQENHQHLWGQHHPKDKEELEMCRAGGAGWWGHLPLPYPIPAEDPRFLRIRGPC